MKWCHPLIHLATLIGLTALVCGQVAVRSGQASSTDTLQDLKLGVVVEEVQKNSAGDQARIQAGDVLLNWSRDDAKGQIESPFDVALIEIEQGPRGAVTLSGFSGDDKRTWVLGPETWGFKTRPNLQRTLLDPYLEGQELAKAGKLTQAVDHWRVEEQNLHTPWFRSWFLFHIAEVLADAKQWQDADRTYQEAVDAEAGTEPAVEEQILLTWGDRFFRRNDTDGAERRYRDALAKSRKLSNESLTMAASLHNLGLVFIRREDFNHAQEYFMQSLAIKERLSPGSLTVSDTLE